MKKRNILLSGVIVLSTIMFTGCFDKETPTPVTPVPPSSESGEEQISFLDEVSTYGNGTDVVSYKGNIYYIEYRNSDISDEAVRSPYYSIDSSSNAQRYLNVIDKRLNVKNLFKVTGSTYFGIQDDRFYLKSSSGYLYTVDMKGENSIELTRGDYLGFDELGHAMYYQNENDPNTLFKIDTKVLAIKTFAFDNLLKQNGYNLLSIRNGKIYYSFFDNSVGELFLFEHDVEKNTNSEVAKLSTGLMCNSEFSSEEERDVVAYVDTVGKYSGLVVGYPCSGTIRGYYAGKGYIFDLDSKDIKLFKDLKSSEGGNYFEDDFYFEVQNELYNLNFGKKLPDIKKRWSKSDYNKFAERYKIDLEATLDDEAKESVSSTPDTNKFSIDLEDYNVVGDKVFYKVTASRVTPALEIGWRPGYIRVATEVYLLDLTTGKDKVIYSYVNNNYEQKIKEVLEQKELEDEDEINNNNDIEDLKEDEMYLEIKVDNIWKKEFDVRVEEVGGTIFGTRIEYEGHHKKDDGTIKIKVAKEVGAMLTVYIDNDRQSQMIIEESM